MSTSTIPRPTRPVEVAPPPVEARPGVARERLVVAGVVLWCLVLALLTWNTWGDLGRDTGYDLIAATHTAGGELPYVDYVYYYGPASPLLLGGLFAVFGAGIGPAIAVGLAIGLSIVALTYRLARLFAGAPIAGAAAALAATAVFGTGNNSFVAAHTLNAPLAIAFALAALLCLGTFLRVGRAAPLVGAGVCAGLAALTRPETAAALIIALAGWAIVHVLRAPDRRRAMADGARLLVPAVAVPAAVYGAFAVAVGPRVLVLENLYPVEQLRAAGSTILRQQAPLTASSFAELGGKLALYGAFVAALALVATALGRVGPSAARRTLYVALPICAAFLVAVLIGRPETVRHYLGWAYGWVPAGAVVAAVLLLARGERDRVRNGVGLALALFLGVASVRAYGAFLPQPRPDGPQATAYLLPLVAVFLVWLHGSRLAQRRPVALTLAATWIAALAFASAWLVVNDASSENRTVRGPGGAMTAPAGSAGAYQAAVRELQALTAPGDPVLIAPQLSSLYVLSDRSHPLAQLSLLPGALATEADEERAIARLGDVRVAVTDRRPLRIYASGVFGEDFDRRIGAWLRAEFQRVATFRGAGSDAPILDIWQRSAK